MSGSGADSDRSVLTLCTANWNSPSTSVKLSYRCCRRTCSGSFTSGYGSEIRTCGGKKEESKDLAVQVQEIEREETHVHFDVRQRHRLRGSATQHRRMLCYRVRLCALLFVLYVCLALSLESFFAAYLSCASTEDLERQNLVGVPVPCHCLAVQDEGDHARPAGKSEAVRRTQRVRTLSPVADFESRRGISQYCSPGSENKCGCSRPVVCEPNKQVSCVARARACVCV